MARFRSPRYPFIDLESAVDAVRKLRAVAPAGMVKESALNDVWGKASKSSAVAQTVAALGQFGLITILRDGDERTLILTDSAYGVLAREDPGFLHEAARHPKVFRELWRRVEEGQTSREFLMQWLMNQDPPFSVKAASHVLDVFQSTMKFAGLAVGELGDRLKRIKKEEIAVVEELAAPGIIRIVFPTSPTRRDYERLRDYIEAKLNDGD